MKVKRMGITEIWRRIWLFSVNKTKTSESFSKQPTQLIIMAHNCHKANNLPGVGNRTRTPFVGMQEQIAIAIRQSVEYDEI